MSEHDDRVQTRVMRGLVAGVIAGVVASFAMDRLQAAASPLLPSTGDDSEPATEKAADALAKAVIGREIIRRTSRWAVKPSTTSSASV